MLASWNRSPRLLHTRARWSAKSRQYLDPSVKSTGSQSLSVQLTWSCAQFKRASLWSRVKGMHAFLDRRPLCRRRLRTVRVEMFTQIAFLNEFCRVVASTKGWRLVCPTRKRSCLGEVARCRPQSWRWVAEPDVWKRVHALLIILWLTPKTLAIVRCEDPHFSMPMAVDHSSVVNRWRWGCIQDLKCGKNVLETDANL